MRPQISICIPAYKRTEFLKRLLDSIKIQSYTNFEVIVTDDSPSSEVAALCKQYTGSFQLNYDKNQKQLGTPENWNAGIRRASGQWIKLMHDDDWFSSAESLQQFVSAVERHPECDFFFSAYNNVNESNGDVKLLSAPTGMLQRVMANPAVLLAGNIIGPPSGTMYKNAPAILYDSNLKWLVDIEFYIRYLKGRKFFYIDQPLVNIGIGDEQVTQFTFRVAEVEIPEYFKVLEKIGDAQLKNILVFDAWWRLMRNLKITSVDMIRRNGYSGEIPAAIKKMVSFQRKIPGTLLQQGFVSKTMMTICFFLS